MQFAELCIKLVERCIMSIPLLASSLRKVLPHVKHFMSYTLHKIRSGLYVVAANVDDVLIRVAICCVPAFVITVLRD